MQGSDAKINIFSTRVRQLILSYQTLKKENDELYSIVDERDKKIAELEKLVAIKEKEYDALKLTKMIEVSDSDIQKSKARIASLIREVNQCITLLSE